MGSQQLSLAAVAPQQELPPLVTRRAAWPYFSFTTVFDIRGAHGFSCLQSLTMVSGSHRLVAGAAFGIKKLQQLLQGVGVGGVAQEGALALDFHQAFGLQLVEVVRKRGVGDVELFLNLAHHQAFGMGRQQQLHDAQPRLGSHGGEHVGIASDVIGAFGGEGIRHISIIVEIAKFGKRP